MLELRLLIVSEVVYKYGMGKVDSWSVELKWSCQHDFLKIYIPSSAHWRDPGVMSHKGNEYSGTKILFSKYHSPLKGTITVLWRNVSETENVQGESGTYVIQQRKCPENGKCLSKGQSSKHQGPNMGQLE